MSAPAIDPRVEELTRTLAEEFHGTVAVDRIRRCVADASTHFADARIDAYLPLFVARHARRLILEQAQALEGAGSRER